MRARTRAPKNSEYKSRHKTRAPAHLCVRCVCVIGVRCSASGGLARCSHGVGHRKKHTHNTHTFFLQMPETNEKAWGAVKGSNQLVDATDVPTVKRAATASVRLEDLDFDLLELGAEVKKGSAGDSFLELKYAGARLCLTFGELKPDHLVSCPFKAGPPKTKDGMPLGDAWSMSLEISDEQVKKYGELEAWLIKNVKKFKSALPQPKAKAGKSAKELTDEEFESALAQIARCPWGIAECAGAAQTNSTPWCSPRTRRRDGRPSSGWRSSTRRLTPTGTPGRCPPSISLTKKTASSPARAREP